MNIGLKTQANNIKNIKAMFKYLKKAGSILFLPFYIFAQDDVPKWVVNPPETDSNYYRAFEEISTSELNYQQRSEEYAKQRIASQIQSTISARIISDGMEEMDITTKNEFSMYISSITIAQLQNIKILTAQDSNKENFYVFIEYSKNEHRKNVEKNKEKAIALYKEYTLQDRREIDIRLQKLIQSFEYLTLVYSENVKVEIDGKEVNLSTTIQGQIKNILDQLTFKTYNSEFNGVINKELERKLLFNISVRYPPPYRISSGSGKNIPINYEFKNGQGAFDIETGVYSDKNGEVEIGVNRILSSDPRQLIQATVDLLKYQLGLYDSDYFDNKLKRLSQNPSINFNISVSSQLNETVAIYVHQDSGVDEGQVKYANAKFNKEISDRGKFKIKGSRDNIIKFLEDSGYSTTSLCDDNDCRVDLGAFLNVDKLLLIELNVIPNVDLFTCEIIYTNPKNRESKTIGFFETKRNKKDITNIVSDSVGVWVSRFYDKLNPAFLDFSLGTGLRDVGVYIDGKFQSKLPYVFSLDPRENHYIVKIHSPGYEYYIKRFNLGPNNRIDSKIITTKKRESSDIRLIRKTRTRAFARSIVYPGWGQIYSHDITLQSNRKNVGRSFMITGLVALLATAYTWDNYNQSLNKYNDTKSMYSNQTTMDGINEWNQKAINANNNMKNQHTIALTISSVTAALWLGNALEAFINLPSW